MKTPHIITILIAVTCLAATAHAYFDPTIGRWANRDPINERGSILITRRIAGTPRDEIGLYTFVGNNPIGAIDLFGLKMVKTGVKKCNEGLSDNMHGFVAIGDQGYGFYPVSDSCGGVSWGPGQINRDDPSSADCTDIELDDCSYDVTKFKRCVQNKIQQAQQNPPTYSAFVRNCRQWRNRIISSCKASAFKGYSSTIEEFGP